MFTPLAPELIRIWELANIYIRRQKRNMFSITQPGGKKKNTIEASQKIKYKLGFFLDCFFATFPSLSITNILMQNAFRQLIIGELKK